jgi:polysaccharide deacetylase family protein (PEP-CTERM system associated)
MTGAATMLNALTVDVEDYFHVEAFKSVVRREDWDCCEPRVVASTLKILDVLARSGVRATFFVLGWVAERSPELVKEIHAAGHEVGSHGYAHQAIFEQTPREFADDVRRSLDAIEGVTGEKVLGYRAPTFSITRRSLWAIDILKSLGFAYDSSVFPIVHDIYGIPDAPRRPYQIADGLWEFPMTTVRLFRTNLPVGGGAYLRLFPYWFTRLGIRRVNAAGNPAIVYVHPWEVDPDHPRIRTSRLNHFRHYVNLTKTESRLAGLCRDFRFVRVRDLLQSLIKR